MNRAAELQRQAKKKASAQKAPAAREDGAQQAAQQGLDKVALEGRRELLDHRLFEMRHFDSGEYFCLSRDEQEEYLHDIEVTQEVGHHHAHSHRGDATPQQQRERPKHRLEETNVRARAVGVKRMPMSATSVASSGSSAATSSSPVTDDSKFPFSPPRGTVASKQASSALDVDTNHEGRRALLERTLRRVRRFDSGDFFAGAPPEEAIAGTSPPRLRVMRTRALQVETNKNTPLVTSSPSSAWSSASSASRVRQPNRQRQQQDVADGRMKRQDTASAEGRLKRNESASGLDMVECGTPPESAEKPKEMTKQTKNASAALRLQSDSQRQRKKQQHPRFDSADFFRGALTDAAAIARVKDAPLAKQEAKDEVVVGEARRVVLERSMRRARRFDSADFFAGVPAEEDVVARSPDKANKNADAQELPPPAATPSMGLGDTSQDQGYLQNSSARMAQQVLHRRMQRQDSNEAAKRKARQRFAAKVEGVAGRHGSVESKTSDDGFGSSDGAEGPKDRGGHGSARTGSARPRHTSSLGGKAVTFRQRSESAAAAARERLQSPHSPRVHRFDSADYFRGIDTDDFVLQTASGLRSTPSKSRSAIVQAPYSPPIQSPPPGPSRLRKTSYEGPPSR